MKPKYIDIHSHVNFPIFNKDRKEVIGRALASSTWLINIGSQIETSKKAVAVANEYENGVFASIGLHPINTVDHYFDENETENYKKDFLKGEIFDKEEYRNLYEKGKVVAIGECGLDYYHTKKENRERQKKAFIQQIELANELNLPLMLHIRDSEDDLESSAYQDTLSVLKEHSRVKGVIHFFAGTEKDAKDFIDFGFFLSFAGVITYPPKNNNPRNINIHKIIKNTPVNRILADTDSPYVAPIPYRGKRNEPIYVKEIVRKIAEIKEINEEELASQVVDNAFILFNLSPRGD